MQRIVYYVAVSLDGYIAGPDNDISAFVQQGPAVDQYFADLQQFQTVIMGRKTYEFGYQFGLEPGQPAYPHMHHYIFSSSLSFTSPHEKVEVIPYELDALERVRSEATTDIYLCGGGTFAGWLLNEGVIDRLKIKLNPIVLGGGTPLFSGISESHRWQLSERMSFEDGLQFLTYEKVRT